MGGRLTLAAGPGGQRGARSTRYRAARSRMEGQEGATSTRAGVDLGTRRCLPVRRCGEASSPPVTAVAALKRGMRQEILRIVAELMRPRAHAGGVPSAGAMGRSGGRTRAPTAALLQGVEGQKGEGTSFVVSRGRQWRRNLGRGNLQRRLEGVLAGGKAVLDSYNQEDKRGGFCFRGAIEREGRWCGKVGSKEMPRRELKQELGEQ